MSVSLHWLVLTIFLSFLFTEAKAVLVPPQVRGFELTTSMQICQPGKEGMPQGSTLPRDFSCQPLGDSQIRKPYSSDPLWLRVDLENASEQRLDRILYFSSTLTGTVHLWGESTSPLLSGSAVPVVARAIPSRLTAFPVHLEAGARKQIWLERTSHHAFSSRVFLVEANEFRNADEGTGNFLLFYFGGIVFLVIYNFLVGVFSRQKVFVYYSAFALSFALTTLAITGFLDVTFLPNATWTPSNYLMCFSSFSVLSATTFVYQFLDIKKYLPRARWGFLLILIAGSITFIAGFFAPMTQAQWFFGNLVDLVISVSTLYLMIIAIRVHRQGNPMAKIMILSWASVLFGVAIYLLTLVGILPNMFLTQNALVFANSADMLILALGLAYKLTVLDAEVKFANQRLKENERYQTLVKVLSHDIANALAVISAYISRLRNATLGAPEQRAVDKIYDATNRMMDTLSFVREEEKLKSFQQTARLENVDLHEVVHDVIGFFEEHLEGKEIAVHVKVPSQTFVKAEKSVLANQVLSNLVSNSIKFCHKKGQISIRLDQAADHIALVVEDNGIGIKAKDIARIFHSSELVSSSGTAREKGTGMGASLAREYMKMFNGDIQVSSTHESEGMPSGTKVRLIFPPVSQS